MTDAHRSVISWEDIPLVLSARVVPRWAFLTASIVVTLGGRSILETGGVFKVVGSKVQVFEHQGERHQARLSWGMLRLRSFPVTLTIDELPITETSVQMSNWWLAYWPWLVLLGVIAWNSR
jgi:hypothetical protein